MSMIHYYFLCLPRIFHSSLFMQETLKNAKYKGDIMPQNHNIAKNKAVKMQKYLI